MDAGPEGVGVEEAKPAKVASNPLEPTRAERLSHEATHLPYRSWCADCVAGRKDNPPHRRMAPEERLVPEVMLDYAFVRRDDETERATILICKDRESRAIRAWVMRYKGASEEEACDRACEGIKSFGHKGRLLIKVDNEPATLALREVSMTRLENGVIPVKPPEHESQSNGSVENGVKLFKGML